MCIILVLIHEFLVLAVLGDRGGGGWSNIYIYMDNHQHQHENERTSPRHKPFVARCCSCPRVLASSIFRRIGRCMFVSCYPVIQCFGCDNHRHRHHNHHHKHFFWFILHYCLWLCCELQALNFKALVTSKFSLLVPTH